MYLAIADEQTMRHPELAHSGGIPSSSDNALPPLQAAHKQLIRAPEPASPDRRSSDSTRGGAMTTRCSTAHNGKEKWMDFCGAITRHLADRRSRKWSLWRVQAQSKRQPVSVPILHAYEHHYWWRTLCTPESHDPSGSRDPGPVYKPFG